MQLDFESIEKDDLSFRVGLEIARLPGWPKFYGADKTLRDAMHADYKHAAAKKGPGFWSMPNHGGSYRGKKHLNPSMDDKKTVLSKTLGICKLIGFEIDAGQVAGYRQQLGLLPVQPRSRVPSRRQPVAVNPVGSPPASPQPPSSPPSSPASSEPPPPLFPTPLIPPRSPQLPSPSQQPPSSPADHGDGGVGASEDGGDGGGGVGNITECEGGVGGDAGGVGGEEGGDGGDDEEDDEETDGEDYEFDEGIVLDDSTNTYSLEFLYAVFQGCTPHILTNPDQTDRVWNHSKATWTEFMGAKAARVARKPTPHLKRFLGTFEPEHDARLSFTVYQHCNYLRYVLRQDGCGLVVVKVDSVSENDGDDWSKTATIRRVMSTEHAILQCGFEKTKGINLGRRDLMQFKADLEQYQRNHKPWTVGYEVYHESDVVEEVDIRELIGVVRCYPFRSAEAPGEHHFRAPYDYMEADLIYIGEPFQQSIRRRRR
jgi:hypothetical protein